MMAGRTDKAQSRFVFAPKNSRDCVASSAGCHQGDVVRLLADDGIDLNSPAARRGVAPQMVDILRFVNALDLIDASRR
jgi:hypothetical protein